jgi:hypothetical protein
MANFVAVCAVGVALRLMMSEVSGLVEGELEGCSVNGWMTVSVPA